MNRSEYMKGNKRAKKENDKRYEWDIKEKRTRYCDFHRIEDNRYETNLGSFELEVKERIACVPSPYDHLARAEDEAEMASEEDVIRAKLGHLVRKARLTKRQSECYRMIYVNRMSESNVIRAMNISHARLCQLKSDVEAKILRVHHELLMANELRLGFLNSRQKEIFRLRYFERMTFKEIAVRLNADQGNVYRSFKRMQKNIFRGERTIKA